MATLFAVIGLAVSVVLFAAWSVMLMAGIVYHAGIIPATLSFGSSFAIATLSVVGTTLGMLIGAIFEEL